MDPLLLAVIAMVAIILLLVIRRRKAQEAQPTRRRRASQDVTPAMDGPREATRKSRPEDKGIGHQKKVRHKKAKAGTRDDVIVMLLEALESLVMITARPVEDAPQVRGQWEDARRAAERVRLATDEGPPKDDADAAEIIAQLMAGLADIQDVRREVEGLPGDKRAALLDGLCQVNPAHGRGVTRVAAADRPAGVEVCRGCYDMLAAGQAPQMRRFEGEPIWAAADVLDAMLGAPNGTRLVHGR